MKKLSYLKSSYEEYVIMYFEEVEKDASFMVVNGARYQTGSGVKCVIQSVCDCRTR